MVHSAERRIWMNADPVMQRFQMNGTSGGMTDLDECGFAEQFREDTERM